jgi:hypothetical protein
MISRQTSLALAFACLATLSVAVVAKVQRPEASPTAAAHTMQVIELPRVVVTGKVNREARP